MEARRLDQDTVRSSPIRSALNQNLSPLIELQKFDLRIAEIKDRAEKSQTAPTRSKARFEKPRSSIKQTSASVETSVKERRIARTRSRGA